MADTHKKSNNASPVVDWGLPSGRVRFLPQQAAVRVGVSAKMKPGQSADKGWEQRRTQSSSSPMVLYFGSLMEETLKIRGDISIVWLQN
jgi:hypothetical protein